MSELTRKMYWGTEWWGQADIPGLRHALEAAWKREDEQRRMLKQIGKATEDNDPMLALDEIERILKEGDPCLMS